MLPLLKVILDIVLEGIILQSQKKKFKQVISRNSELVFRFLTIALEHCIVLLICLGLKFFKKFSKKEM